MLNKKIIVIIILAIIIFFSSVGLVFFFVKQAGSKAIVNKVDANITRELKNNHPEFSAAQLKFYADAAAQGTISSCNGRADESACISSVAFIKGDSNLCHELGDNNEKLGLDCVGAVRKQIAKIEISRCESLLGDAYYNCLEAFFVVDNQRLDCASFLEAGTRLICQDILNYKAAYLSYDRELCKTVKTEKLNKYCLSAIIDKNQDIDKDGLTDLDEINKYHTDPKNPDTCGYGITDEEAVKLGLFKNGCAMTKSQAIEKGILKAK